MLNINRTLYLYLQAGPCIYLILFSKKHFKGIVQPYDIPKLCKQKRMKNIF